MIRTLESLQLDGGCVVFDFINTVDARIPTSTFDYLQDYNDLLAWSEKVKLLDRKRLEVIGTCLKSNQQRGERAFRKAIKVRELLYALFSAIAKGRSPNEDVVESFNVWLAQAFSKIKITIKSGGSKVYFTDTEISLDEPLWKILTSAYQVLMESNPERIRECPRCGWLFLDTSKNGKRKWCNMQVCGSHDKALRYYYKKSSGGDQTE